MPYLLSLSSSKNGNTLQMQNETTTKDSTVDLASLVLLSAIFALTLSIIQAPSPSEYFAVMMNE